MKTLPIGIECKDCQIASNPGTRGAYNFADCRDCRVRYAIDCIGRLSPSKREAEATKDALFDALLKGRDA